MYRHAGFQDAKARAKARKFFNMLYSHPNIKVIMTREIAEKAAEIKLDLRIAISDCYLLAITKTYDVPAVFRSIEKEMQPVIDKIKSKFNVIFLSEI